VIQVVARLRAGAGVVMVNRDICARRQILADATAVAALLDQLGYRSTALPIDA
jgi:hypothetical protein